MTGKSSSPQSLKAATRGPVPRLSRNDSRRFADLMRQVMDDCGLPSTYSLFLRMDDTSRSTIHRWLSGEVRIPVASARELTTTLIEHASRLHGNQLLTALDNLVRNASEQPRSKIALLRAELRARGVRVNATLEALRAVSLLPDDHDCD